jgi:hypothetical protein
LIIPWRERLQEAPNNLLIGVGSTKDNQMRGEAVDVNTKIIDRLTILELECVKLPSEHACPHLAHTLDADVVHVQRVPRVVGCRLVRDGPHQLWWENFSEHLECHAIFSVVGRADAHGEPQAPFLQHDPHEWHLIVVVGLRKRWERPATTDLLRHATNDESTRLARS